MTSGLFALRIDGFWMTSINRGNKTVCGYAIKEFSRDAASRVKWITQQQNFLRELNFI